MGIRAILCRLLGHRWEFSGGTRCHKEYDDCSREMHECTRCGAVNVGPGWKVCLECRREDGFPPDGLLDSEAWGSSA